MTFSHNGNYLAAAHEDGTIRLWNVTEQDKPAELGSIAISRFGLSAAFNPDDRLLATTSHNQAAQLWDLTDPRRPKQDVALRGHTSDVITATFSPDGSTIATSGRDHTIRLWKTNMTHVANRICKIAYPRINPNEWNQHFPGLEYQPPCP